jgi:hypothetical protein
MRTVGIITAFLAVSMLSACATFSRSASDPPSPEAWGALLNTTDYLANAGRHAAADSTLSAFATRHPGTRAAEEVLFWRALYKLDPRSSAATRAEGRALLDSYLASEKTAWYRGQANVLRHLAREIVLAEQVASQASGDTTIVITDTSAAGIAARDRVIRTQRAEIARLNAELERIKRRLAAPTP